MNQKRASRQELLAWARVAHQRAAEADLGDIQINILIRICDRMWMDWLNRSLQPYGLNHLSYIVLMKINSTDHNQISPSTLALNTGETRANMTRLCDDLVERKLIRRVPSSTDRRRVELSVTEEAQALLKLLVPDLREQVKTALAPFSEGEKDTLIALLTKLSLAMDPAATAAP